MAGEAMVKMRLWRYHFRRWFPNCHQLINYIETSGAILRFRISGKYFPPKKPLILMIEPTNICNYHCPLCDRGAGRITRQEGMMKRIEMKKILEMADSKLKIVMLWNQGEPFLNPELMDLIGELKRRKIFCIISTNGSLLEKYAERVVGTGLDELIVSLDGASSETYNFYRQSGDFGCIISGIQKLVQCRGKSLIPLITLQFLLMKHNAGEIVQFRRLAKNLGVDRVKWKTVQVANQDEADKFLPQNNRLSRYEQNRWNHLKRKGRICQRILYSAVIDWNGNMVPCCFDKDEEYMAGNVLDEGLEAVWRSDKFKDFRTKMRNGEYPSMCCNCTEGLKSIYLSPDVLKTSFSERAKTS